MPTLFSQADPTRETQAKNGRCARQEVSIAAIMPNPSTPCFLFMALLPAISLWASSAGAQKLQAFVDDDGVVHISDTKSDVRQAPYQIGDFERMALHLPQTPHAGLGFQSAEKVRAFLMAANGNRQRNDDYQATRTRYDQYDDVIRSASEKYDVPFSLVKAVVAVESAFKKDALSRVGAQGLMQLMPKTAAELGVRDPYDPKQNIDGGTRYLAGLLRMFSNDDLAIAAYNAGPGRVRRAGRVPRIKETQAYVQKVTKLRALYEASSGSPQKNMNAASLRAPLSISPRRRESK